MSSHRIGRRIAGGGVALLLVAFLLMSLQCRECGPPAPRYRAPAPAEQGVARPR